MGEGKANLLRVRLPGVEPLAGSPYLVGFPTCLPISLQFFEARAYGLEVGKEVRWKACTQQIPRSTSVCTLLFASCRKRGERTRDACPRLRHGARWPRTSVLPRSDHRPVASGQLSSPAHEAQPREAGTSAKCAPATLRCAARNAPVFGAQRAGVSRATRRCFARNAPVCGAQRAGVSRATRRCAARNAPVCGARATPARSARFASNPEPSGSGARSLWSRPAWSCSLRLRCRTPSPCPLRARRS